LVANTGEEEGSYTITLKIDGVVEETKEITLARCGTGFLERRISNVNALRAKADNNNKNPRRNGE